MSCSTEAIRRLFLIGSARPFPALQVFQAVLFSRGI